MAIKFGTQGWVTQINADGGIDNVNTVQYPVNGVNTVVWKRPMVVTITNFENYMRIDNTKPGIFKPGYNSTSVSASYWSQEPTAVDQTATPNGDVWYWTKPTYDQTYYGTDFYHGDYIFLQYEPWGKQNTDYWGYGLYYLTPTAGEVEPNGITKITNDGTYTLPALHKNYYIIRGTCSCGTWVEMAYKTTSTGNWTTVAGTATYGTKDYYYRSTINISRVGTTGLKYIPVNTTETESGFNDYLCYYTPVPNVNNQYYAYFSYGDTQPLTLGFYVEYTHQVPRPAQSDPVTVYLRPTEVQAAFYKVTGTVQNASGIDITNTLSTAGYLYWDSNNKENIPTAPINYAENNHTWGSTHAVKLVSEVADKQVYAYIKDATGGYIPSWHTSGQEWSVYSGTKYAQNAIYRATNDTEYISNYTWNLGQIDFIRYIKVTLGSYGVNCQLYNNNLANGFPEALIGEQQTHYVPEQNITNAIYSLCGTYDTELSLPVCPIILDQDNTGYPISLTGGLRVSGSHWTGDWIYQGGEIPSELNLIFRAVSVTWAQIRNDVMDGFAGTSATVIKNNVGYAWQIANAKVACTPTEWTRLNGQIYGSWSGATATAMTTYTTPVSTNRVYYAARKTSSSSTATYTLASLKATDLIGEHNFNLNTSKTFVGYSTTYRNYGLINSTWYLYGTSYQQYATPTSRNASVTNRKYWKSLRSPTTDGTYAVYGLHQAISASAVATDPDIQSYTYTLRSTVATSAPSNWNGNSGTPTNLSVWSKTKTDTGDYTATSYFAQSYQYSSSSYAPVIVVSTATQNYVAPTELMPPEVEEDGYFGYGQATYQGTAYYFSVYNGNNQDLSLTGYVTFETSTGYETWEAPGYNHTVTGVSYDDWVLVMDNSTADDPPLVTLYLAFVDPATGNESEYVSWSSVGVYWDEI